MFHPNSDKNKFGYYSVGSYRTYSKIDAIKYSSTTSDPLVWNFNDEVYDRIDWNTEPVETLQQIYRRRAQQIRDRYDYLILMYSGGADSTHVLRSFIDNGIHLDEICSVHEYEGQKDRHAYHTGEILNSAIPIINSILPPNSPTKVRIVDSSQEQYDALMSLSVDSRDESYLEYNVANNLANLRRFRVREYVKDYRDLIDAGKKVCLIWGEAKPQTRWNEKEQKHEFVFEEQSYDMICNVKQQQENHPGYHDEMFYHSPDCPEIVVKQAHVCLSLLKNRVGLVDMKSIETIVKSGLGDFTIRNPLLTQVETKDNFCLSKDVMHASIYPGQSLIIYDQGKNANRLYHPRDEWLRKSAADQSKIWYQGFLRMIEQVSDDWKMSHWGKVKYSLKRMTKRHLLPW